MTTCLLIKCSMEAVTQPALWLSEAMNFSGEWTWPGQWVSIPSSKMALNRVVTPKLDVTDNVTPKYPSGTTVARTLSLTPTLAQPTSPLKKDLHSFKYPTVERSESLHDRRSSVIGVKLQKIGQEQTSSALFSAVISGMRSRHSSGAPGPVDGRKNLTSPSGFIESFNLPLTNKLAEKVSK